MLRWTGKDICFIGLSLSLLLSLLCNIHLGALLKWCIRLLVPPAYVNIVSTRIACCISSFCHLPTVQLNQKLSRQYFTISPCKILKTITLHEYHEQHAITMCSNKNVECTCVYSHDTKNAYSDIQLIFKYYCNQVNTQTIWRFVLVLVMMYVAMYLP